jgi:hypothetical protein
MKIRILLFIFISTKIFAVVDVKEQENFLKSFINYYDFTTVGRYTHEYHPFLFEKSSYSLDELEKSLTENGLLIKGRVVVAGYEEQAVPSYSTNYKACTGSKINDEVCLKGRSGWVSQLHNKFGIMTGFLFRGVGSIRRSLFEHINLHRMPIFNSDASIFQKHAFGDLFELMLNYQDIINRGVFRQDGKKVFATLISFWKNLYDYELQFGNRQVLGTQDVLFSIAHARHLYRSDVPLFKYYVGPDITYPIKITSAQKKAATYHAQTFVKNFVKNLKSVDGKPTAYIFCSFVDGVGKSTLLGNTQNYKKYGDKLNLYEPVDNSSSQLAQLYEYDKGVFIADLPAQMSHFTYKPDGMVYFNLLSAGYSGEKIKSIVDFVREKKEILIDECEKLIEDVAEIIFKSGWFDPRLSDKNKPEFSFAKNLILLDNVYKNNWIPFSYKDKNYLFHLNDPSRIRVLVGLEKSDSVGLKNYEAEQMLFFEGLRFPIPYKKFVADLVEKLKSRNVERVVFVDFLSMYPRSSRENIRINYLLQQLSLLNNDFSVKNSPYGTFINDAQLLYKLKCDRSNSILKALHRESMLRLSIFNLMNEKQFDSNKGVSLKDVSFMVIDQLKKLPKDIVQTARSLADEKISFETKALDRLHGNTKNFVNIQQLEFDDVIMLNRELKKIFTEHLDYPRLSKLWKEPAEIVDPCSFAEGAVNKTIVLSDGKKAKLLFVVSQDCKDETLLAPILRLIRASWYASLSNLIGGTVDPVSRKILIGRERYFVAPIWVRKIADGRIAILRRVFKKCEKKVSEQVSRTMDLVNMKRVVGHGWGIEKALWGIFGEVPYLLNLENSKTNICFFAFGAGPKSKKRNIGRKEICFLSSRFLQRHKNKNGTETIIPATVHWNKINRSFWWRKNIYARLRKEARANEKKSLKKKKQDGDEDKEGENSSAQYFEKEKENKKKKTLKKSKTKSKIRLGKKEHAEVCRLVVKMLAKIELIVKDVDSDVVVRRDSKKDFAAALKLFEKLVLPAYFNIIFESNLFESYEDASS